MNSELKRTGSTKQYTNHKQPAVGFAISPPNNVGVPGIPMQQGVKKPSSISTKKKGKRDDIIDDSLQPSIVASSSMFVDVHDGEDEIAKMNRLLDTDDDDNRMPLQIEHNGPLKNSLKASMNDEVSDDDFYEDDEKSATQPEEEPTVFVDPPLSSLTCPIHKGLFVQPVIANCGHTFCKACILSYMDRKTKEKLSAAKSSSITFECPLDKLPLRSDLAQNLIPNIIVAESLVGLRIYCKYGCKKVNDEWVRDVEGCPEVMPLAKRKVHEDVCTYALIPCPYNPNCTALRRKNLEEHLKSCKHVTCPHRKYGCTVEGTKAAIDQHVNSCSYEHIKGYLMLQEKTIKTVKKKLQHKEEENKQLREIIVKLNVRLDTLADNFGNKSARFEATIRQLTTSLEGTQNQLSEANSEIEGIKSRLKRKNNNAGEAPILESELTNLNCKGTFTGHQGPVWGLAVTSEGFLISASSDMTIKIWDVANFKCKQTLTGHEGIVHAVVVIGVKLCSGSSDKSIRVWDLSKNGECVKIMRSHDNTICSLATAENSNILFSGSYMEIKAWDMDTYECIQTLTGPVNWVRALTACGNRLYSGSYNIIHIWDITKDRPFQSIRTITGNNGSIYSLAVAKDHNRLLSGTYENKINVYDLDTLKCIQMLDGHIGAVYTLAVMGNRFFSGSYDSTIKVWNLDTFKPLQTLVRHSSSVDALVAAGGCIFSGSADHSVKVWK